jgi:hypothetical protein
MNNVSEKGPDFIGDLGDAVRKNPLSAALIGMGVLWLFAGSRPVERVGDFARSSGLDRIPHAAGSAFDAARSTLRSGTDSVGERMASAKDVVKGGVVDAFDSATRYGREYADTASEYVTSIPGSSAKIFDTVRSNLTDLFKAQPLALGAIGIAIGAGIAAALPGTEIEADYLGETSDTLRAKAVQFAAEQTDRVTIVAGNVVDAVKEEAATQGLTLEGVKTAAGDISAKVGRVVDASGKSISDRASLRKL